MKEIDPREAALDGIEPNRGEVLPEEFTRELKRGLCTDNAMYLNLPEID